LVRHAKGMLFCFILFNAYKVVDIGVFPLTKTPSISVTITGLYVLCLRFLKCLTNAAIF